MSPEPAQAVIFGVGRSGTTALFHYMRGFYETLGRSPEIRYEPYLWAVREGEINPRFEKTDGLSPEGIVAHRATPLFADGTDNPYHGLFLDHLDVRPDCDAIVKFIRATGRIELFLDAWPEARFVYIFRNPAAVVNSVVRMFSFFGDEFHPTDEPRFAAETGRDEATFRALSYAERQIHWWRAMNAAGMAALERHPDRILPISQEALLLEPHETLTRVADHVFGPDVAKELGPFIGEAKAGTLSTSPFKNLRIQDYDVFGAQMSWYAKTLLPLCRAGVQVDGDAIIRAADQSWSGTARRRGLPAPDWEDPPRDTSPLLVRKALEKANRDLSLERNRLGPLARVAKQLKKKR